MRYPLNLFLACLLALLATSVTAAPLATQSSTVSGVTIKATPTAVSGERWTFDIVLDTHAGELSDDLMKSASLVVDNEAALSPLDWRGAAPGGHHRKGVLQFKAATSSPESIELRIQRTGEPAPRVFRWQLR
jgi:hypothetical protein